MVLDTDGRNVLVANCGSGNVAVLPVGADGRLGEATDIVKATGKAAPCITLDRESRFGFVCDPASDRVLSYRFDAQHGKLTPHLPASTPTKAGAGPRRMLFRPDGRFAYVANEKNSTITVCAYDATAGVLSEVQTISTLPEYFDGDNTAGELGIHRSGKWLYVSNSGEESAAKMPDGFNRPFPSSIREART